MPHLYRKIAASIILSFFTSVVFCQKLPAVQTTGLRAPDNIKVDGKPTEWGNKFQAYNNRVEFYYTLCNNDENLFLTVQATNLDIVKRIITGGITLAVNASGKKTDAGAAGITFPVYDGGRTSVPDFDRGHYSVRSTRTYGADGQPNGFNSVTTYYPMSQGKMDTLMRNNNTSFASHAKNIGTKGISGLDSVISVII